MPIIKINVKTNTLGQHAFKISRALQLKHGYRTKVTQNQMFKKRQNKNRQLVTRLPIDCSQTRTDERKLTFKLTGLS